MKRNTRLETEQALLDLLNEPSDFEREHARKVRILQSEQDLKDLAAATERLRKSQQEGCFKALSDWASRKLPGGLTHFPTQRRWPR